MSKSSIKKFRKNDWSYDDDEYDTNPKEKVNKRKEKRVERALRTKDITALTEDDEEWDDDLIYGVKQ
jgi:hypothetical protein